MQAIGRASGVNRTTENPVEVYLILDDTVVPGVTIDEVVELGRHRARRHRPHDRQGTGAADADRRGQAPPGPVSRRGALQKKHTSAPGLRTERGPRGPRLVTSP